jgi:hypothetical protein
VVASTAYYLTLPKKYRHPELVSGYPTTKAIHQPTKWRLKFASTTQSPTTKPKQQSKHKHTIMPNKSIPTVGDSNWGTPLNAHLAQLQNPTNGGINTFEQFSQRPTNLTADDVGKTYLYTQTGNLHQWTGTIWKVLNESVINVKDYGAVGDGVVDDTVAIQSYFGTVAGTFKSVYLSNGTYQITNKIKVPNAVKIN